MVQFFLIKFSLGFNQPTEFPL